MLAQFFRYIACLYLASRSRLLEGRLRFFLIGTVGIAAIAIVFLNVHPAFAEANGVPGGAGALTDFGNWMIEAVTKMMLIVARIFISMSIFFLRFFIDLAAYNDFIYSPTVVLGWLMVRDVANMFFVVALLVIAFSTILGLESYEWKKAFVKLIIAAIFINFSKLILQAIIDVAHVFTITFLNAVSATAAGNLINMFKLDKILSLLGDQANSGGNLRFDLFAGGVMAVAMAGMAMVVMGAYLFVMMARMVVLWILIILSPLAFIAQVLPQTKSYADEFWKEFTHHVIVAPVMVFFLWLTFATLGTGDIATQIGVSTAANAAASGSGAVGLVTPNATVSLSQATTWENLASFFIAIGFLAVGISMVQRLGVQGGGLVSGALEFGKKTALIASGFALGRWLTGKGQTAATEGLGLAGKGLYGATIGNRVEIIKNWGERQIEGYKDWRALGPKAKVVKDVLSEEEIQKQKLSAGDEGYYDATGKLVANKDRVKVNDKGEEISQFVRNEKGNLVYEDYNPGLIQGFLHKRHEKLIKSKKLLEKVKNETKVREELMDKRVTANPKYFMQRFEGMGGVDAWDRVQQGMLEAEKMRSAAKTEEFGSYGKDLVLENRRFKDGKWQAKTISEMVAQHKAGAGLGEASIKVTLQQAGQKFAESKQGKSLSNLTNAAEAAAKAAEIFAHNVKGHQLTHQYEHAAEKMQEIMKKKTGKELEEALEDAAKDNVYIRNFQAQVLGKIDEQDLGWAETLAAEGAKAGFFEIPKLGRATPSTALSSMIDEADKELAPLEAQGGAMQAATWIAHILRAREEDPNKHVAPQQLARLFAAVAHFAKEAQTDDAIAEMVDLFDDLKNDRILKPDGTVDEDRKKDVKKMKEIFVDNLKLINQDDETGEYFARFGPQQAAALQQLVSLGGNADMVQDHNVVAHILRELKKAKEAGKKEISYGGVEYGTEMIYSQIAEKLGESGKLLVGSYEKFKKYLEENQEFLAEGHSAFKRAALNAGHIQNGGHIGLDRRMGLYRPNTIEEATKWIRIESSKRKGMEGAQVHSLGEIDLKKGRLVKIMDEYYSTIMSGVTRQLAARNVLPRTRDQMLGYATGADKQMYEEDGKSYFLLGGQNKDIKDTFGGEKAFLRDFILPQLRSQSEALKLISREKGDHVAIPQSENGLARLAIHLGGSNYIKGDKYSEFIEGVRKALVEYDVSLSPEDERLLNNAINTSKAKESNLSPDDVSGTRGTPKRKGGKGKGPSVADMGEDSEDGS